MSYPIGAIGGDVVSLVEAEHKPRLERLLLRQQMEVHVPYYPKHVLVKLNLVPLTVSYRIGENGICVTRNVEEEPKRKQEMFLFLRNMVAQYALN